MCVGRVISELRHPLIADGHAMAAAVVGESCFGETGDNRPALCAVCLIVKRDASLQFSEISFDPVDFTVCADADGVVGLSVRRAPVVRSRLAGDQLGCNRTAGRSRPRLDTDVSAIVGRQWNRGWRCRGSCRDQAVIRRCRNFCASRRHRRGGERSSHARCPYQRSKMQCESSPGAFSATQVPSATTQHPGSPCLWRSIAL